jgi:glucan-binding YG repeat protein/N-acetylmuramoyl-L-alanine amidase
MNLKKGTSMKAKKIISIALAIAMLLMTPTQAVFAEGQQEVTEDANIEIKNADFPKMETTENVPDVTLYDEKINNDTVEENQETEITQQTDKLNYVVVNKKYIEQGDEQQIVVSVGNGITVEAATLNYHRVSDGKTYQAEMTQSNEEALMFDISYVKNAETGEYQLDSLDYSVSGENRKIEFSEAGIDAKYGVNTEVKTDADAQISNPDSSSDNEIVEDVVSFDEEGNQISENSIEEAIAAQQADSTKSRAVASDAKTKNVVVVLDPGHDATHAGAIGVNGLREEVLTLKIARYCKEELQQYSGVTVYMTRESEACPNPGTSSTNDNAKRVAYAKSVGANVYVSIHMNSGASGAHGAEVYYPNSNYRSDIGVEGNKLASKVLEQLVALGLYNRGVKIENSGTGDTYADGSLADKFGVIRGSKNAGFPGIIIEHAFITNSSDAAFLSNENNLKRLGQADAAGIVNYFGLTKGTWIQDSTGWWFRNADGTYPANQWAYINGAWYHFNAAGYRENGWITLNGVRFYLEADGRMVTGWKQMEETWYYFDGSGAMRTGWLQLGSTWYWLDNDGKMVTGWKSFGRYWYYLGPFGNMYVGNCSIDGKRYQFCDTGYVVDSWIYQDGIWYYCNSDRTYVKGFKKIGSATYYFNDKEQMATGWQNINDSWYYFESSGVMKTGWLLLNNTWYWFENDGKMVTGWKRVGAYSYYFEKNGAMCIGKKTIDGKSYDFGTSGGILTGWYIKDNAWYYTKDDLTMAVGMNQIGKNKFYFESNGRMVTGWKYVDNNWYYFDSMGAMRTGWLQLGNTWYWLESDGKMATGWKDFGPYWYYFGASGNMYVGNCSVESKRYQFCNTGYVVDSWIYQNGIWYYCNSDRTYAKGFKQIGGATYYFNDKEQMVTGWQNINDSWYYFEGSGVMKTGWLLLNNTWYWLENDGKMKTGWKSFGNVRYYFEQSGSMVTGVRTIDGQKYDFGADGVCKNVQSGWNLENEDWYYIIDGSPKKGWLLLGNTWYYLDSSTGIMRTGWVNVNNQWYYMDSNGAMLTGYQKIENKWYYFNKSLKDIPNGALGYTGVTPIMGTSTLGKDRVTVVQKIVSHYTASGKLYPSNALNGVGVLGGTGGAPNIVTFCEMIYDEAVFENVRPEILYAQIMLETRYLQYGRDVEINQFNFGGLGATGNGVKGNSFVDVRTGIKAQVQHLKAYASVEPLNATQVVDERFKYVTRNAAPYVEWLGIKENPTGKGWAAAAGYGFNLMKIVNNL